MSASEETTRNNAGGNLYRLFWRWHLYAGLIVSPVLCIVAITGALLVFDEETELWLHPELWIVEPGESRLSDKQLLDLVAKEYPQDKIFSYVRTQKEDRSYVYWLTGDYRGFLEVFVDPYRGVLLGDRLRERSFLRITEQLHRRLLAGKWGSIVVDATTGWTIVLLLTGLYMWWPKNLRGLIYGLTIRLSSSLKKFNWQLHNTVGFYAFAVLLLVCLTGMVVSEVTGTMYRRLMFSTGAFPASLITPPKSKREENATPISIDDAIKHAESTIGRDMALDIRLPLGEDGSYLIATKVDGSDMDNFHAVIIDQYSGETLESMPWNKAHLLMKTRSVSLAIHFGSIYGLPTKIIAFIACLSVPLLCITGFLIWWWKRPRGQQNRQKKESAPTKIPVWLGLTMLVCFVLFPTVAVTSAAAYGYGVLRRKMKYIA